MLLLVVPELTTSVIGQSDPRAGANNTFGVTLEVSVDLSAGSRITIGG